MTDFGGRNEPNSTHSHAPEDCGAERLPSQAVPAAGRCEGSDTACQIPFVAWWCLWLVGASFALVLFAKDLLSPSLDHRIGRDFTNLWTAGRLALEGRGYWVFDLDTFRLGLMEFLHMPSLQNYSYPPHALFLAAPFALMPYYTAYAVWTVVSILFFVWAARPYLPKGFPPILAALTPAACINIWNGHYSLLLGGLWLLFFRWFEKRPISAGATAALLTIKPHLGLAIAYTALSKREVVFPAVVIAVGLIATSALVFGFGTWSEFLFNTTSVQNEILNRQADEFYMRMMPSAYVTWGRGALGATVHLAVAGSAIFMLLRYGRWDAFIAATVTALLVPYLFNYDLPVVSLGLMLALYRYWDDLDVLHRTILALGFLSPNLTYAGYLAWTIPFILLACLSLQLRIADHEAEAQRRRMRREPAAA